MHLMGWNSRKGIKAGVAFPQVSAYIEGNKQNIDEKMDLDVQVHLETRTLS